MFVGVDCVFEWMNICPTFVERDPIVLWILRGSQLFILDAGGKI